MVLFRSILEIDLRGVASTRCSLMVDLLSLIDDQCWGNICLSSPRVSF